MAAYAQAVRWGGQPTRRTTRTGDTSFAEAELSKAKEARDLWAPLERGMALRGDEATLYDEELGAISYVELSDRATRLAAWLNARVAGPGSTVGVLLHNSTKVIECHYAIARIGCVVLNLNTRLSASELAYVLEAAECEVVICSESDRVDARVVVRSDLEPEESESSSSSSSSFVAKNAGGAAEMYFTSGTTGRPKGVVLEAEVVLLHALGCMVEHRLKASDAWLHAAPMFHLVDAYAIFAITWVGGSHVSIPFSLDGVIDAVRTKGITVTNVASTMITMLVSTPDVADLGNSLDLLSCGGAPLARATAAKLLAVYRNEFFQSYGMTECCGKIAMSLIAPELRATLTPAQTMDLVCTSGRPFRLMNVRVVDPESGEDVGAGEVGEVWIKGPTVFGGYHKLDPTVGFRGEWFRTGDLAFTRPDGYLTITDRLKDMILVGSENVYCVEVERALHEHPDVIQACVFGVPDAALGERVKAVVRARRPLDPKKLTLFASTLLADFKVPQIVEFVDEFPLTGSGKIAKGELKKKMKTKSDDLLLGVDWERVGPPPAAADVASVVCVVVSGCGDDKNLASMLSCGGEVVRLEACDGLLSEAALAADAAALERTRGRRRVLFVVDETTSPHVAVRHSLAVARREFETYAVVARAGAVWGFWRSFATETSATVRLVEVVGSARREDVLAVAFPRGGGSCNEERRLVDGMVYRPVLKPRTPPAVALPDFRGTTHLVTGASGGLGRELSERLAAMGAAKLVLASRRGNSSSSSSSMTGSIEAVVVVVACDVADRSAVRELMARFGPFDAIWHLAGAVDDGFAKTLSPDRVLRVLRPKVDGSLALAEFSPPSTKLVMFSSVYGLLGSPQLTHYAAANAFQDALATRRPNSLSVSWGTWADAGMAHRFGPDFRKSIEAAGMRMIELDEGFDLLFRLYATGETETHAAAIPADWKKYGRSRRGMKPQPLAEALTEGAVVEDPPRAKTPVDDARSKVRRVLKEVIGLGFDDDDKDDSTPLATLGVSSLHAVAFANALSEATGLDLPPTLVFECVSVAGVVEHISSSSSSTRDDETKVVRRVLKEVIGVGFDDDDKDDSSTPLATLGVSSLHAVAFANALSEATGLDLPPTLVFECVSISGVADRIKRGRRRRHDPVKPPPQQIQEEEEARMKKVVGAACRLPGSVDDVASLWHKLETGSNCVTAPFAGRPHAGRPAGYLSAASITCFDGEAFGMSHAEACVLDPQQRLALACGAETLQFLVDASDDVSTFVGATQVDYANVLAKAKATSAYEATGAATIAAIANRIPYVFDLKGPSAAVDTACSSTLVALHLASQQPTKGAVVGGVNAILSSRWSDAFSRAGMLSPTHRCAFASDDADGYVRGEASSFVALLDDQKEEQQQQQQRGLFLFLEGVSVNQDGRSNGLTAPNPASQVAMLRRRRRRANVPAYVEAHGTGTRLGDPIELEALSRVYGDKREPLLTASLKSNFGHSECAAAGSSLVKLVCLSSRRDVPISLHVRKLNSHLDWANLGVEVVAAPGERLRDQEASLACSGFGFAGTNAHAVLLAAPPATGVGGGGGKRPAGPVVVLESHSREGLKATARRWARFGGSLAGVAAANAARRKVFKHCNGGGGGSVWRAAARDEASLEAIADGEAPAIKKSVAKPNVCVVFAGQGTAYAGMGRDLSVGDEGLERAIRDAARIADGVTGLDVTGVLFDREKPPESRLLQPAQVCLQYAVFGRLEATSSVFKEKATVMVGHSLGEISACACAGLATLESALAFAARRGAAVDALPAASSWGMLALRGSEVPEGCELAVVNSPESVVVAGPTEILDEKSEGKRLKVAAAFHSSAIEPALPAIKAAAAELVVDESPRRFDRRVVSTLTGVELGSSNDDDDFDHWVRHAREVCDFAAAVRTAAESCDVFVEIGPRPQLARHVEATCCEEEVVVLPTVFSSSKRRIDLSLTRSGLDALWIQNETLEEDLPFPPHAVSYEKTAWVRDMIPDAGDSTTEEEDWACSLRLVYDTEWVKVLRPTVIQEEEEEYVVFERAPGDEDVEAAIEGLVEVLRAAAAAADKKTTVIVVTNGACEGRDLVGAALWGACETARLEEEKWRKIVCVDAEDRDEAVAAALGNPDEVSLRIRDGDVEALRLRPSFDHHGASSRWFPKKKFPRGGAVLITGGAGALGTRVARWLRDDHDLRPILLSRRDVPSSEFETRKCDVSDWDAVRDAVAAILKKKKDRIVGAIHAAGVLDDAAVATLSVDQIRRVVRPKVRGALNLARALRDEDVDFVWFFSSVTALMGNPGQTVYGAANAVLDAIARRSNHEQQQNILSIQWGPWAERGMAAGVLHKLEASPWVPMSDDDALDGLGAVLNSNNDSSSSSSRVVAVARLNAQRIRASMRRHPHRARFFSNIISPPEDHRERRDSSVGAPPAEEVFEDGDDQQNQAVLLRAVLEKNGASTRGLERSTSLASLGLDSLDSASVASDLAAAFGIIASPMLLLELESYGDLCDRVAQEAVVPATTTTTKRRKKKPFRCDDGDNERSSSFETKLRAVLEKNGASTRGLERSTSLASLGLDSLDSASVASDLAAAFGIIASPMLLLELESYGDLCDRVAREVPPQQPLVPPKQQQQRASSSEGTLRAVLEAHGASTRGLERSTPIASLGLDSLDSASVASDLAAAFGIIASPMLLLELETYGDLCDTCGGSSSVQQEVVVKPEPRDDASANSFAGEALAAIEALRLPSPGFLLAWGFAKVVWWATRIAFVFWAVTSAFPESYQDLVEGERRERWGWFALEWWISGTMATVVMWGASLGFGLAAKWVLVGEYREVRRESNWSWYALRCELADRAVAQAEASCLWAVADGSGWLRAWYRALGANVGANAILSRGACARAPDLVAIGEGAIFERGAACEPCRQDPGAKCFGARKVVVGPRARVSVEARAYGGCVLGAGAVAEPGAAATGLVPTGARATGHGVVFGLEKAASHLESSYYSSSSWFLDILEAVCLVAFGAVPASMLAAVAYHLYASVAASYVLFGTYLCFFAIITKRALLGARRREDVAVELATQSLARRMSFADRAAALAAENFVDLFFSSTIIQNLWLNMLGADVAWSADVACFRDFRASTAEFFHVGEGAFLAGIPRISCAEVVGEVVRFSAVRVEAGAYVGFGASLLPGTTVKTGGAVADSALVGPRRVVESRTTIVGVQGYSDREIAFKRRRPDLLVTTTSSEPTPTYHLILLTCLGFAVGLEYALISASLRACAFVVATVGGKSRSPSATLLAILPFVRLLAGCAATLAALLHKRLVLGTIRPLDDDDHHRTSWRPRSFGIIAWLVQFRLNIAVDAWFEPLAFTPLIAALWRTMGASVGPRARLARLGPPDHDALRVGSRAYLGATGVVYAHDFAGGGLGFKRCVIGDDVSVFGPSAVLPGTRLAPGVSLAPGSMTLAGTYEKRDLHGLYKANPARPCMGPAIPPDDAPSSLFDDRADADWLLKGDNVRPTPNRLLDDAFRLVVSASSSSSSSSSSSCWKKTSSKNKKKKQQQLPSSSSSEEVPRAVPVAASSWGKDDKTPCAAVVVEPPQPETNEDATTPRLRFALAVAAVAVAVAVAPLASALGAGAWWWWWLNSTDDKTGVVVPSFESREEDQKKILVAVLLGSDEESWAREKDLWRACCMVDATRALARRRIAEAPVPAAIACATSPRALMEKIERATKHQNTRQQQQQRVALLFGGESLYAGVADGLWEGCDEFRRAARRAIDVFAAEGVALRFGTALVPRDTKERNALAFVVQYALARLVCESWDLRPVGVLGYSIGELAAAVISGTLTLRDVARLFAATTYSRFDDREGAMAVVSRTTRSSLVRDLGDACIAAEYSDETFMIAGAARAVREARFRLESRDATCTILKEVRRAYHSPLHSVQTAKDFVLLPISNNNNRAGERERLPPFYSCALGARIPEKQCRPKTTTDLGALYDAPVLFSRAIDALIEEAAPTLLLDLSLKADLSYYYSTWCQDNKKNNNNKHQLPRAIPTLRPDTNASERLALAAADLILSGASLSPSAALGL
ncbi:hypothetical protein CTAYLR_003120 [Chrysophaeum taylorii]|uniref:Uncharacterized protein n=1 Tax=Chrysophaeum taylorii TaxID=2483200 RepID=A0AAD7XUB6_9STRA|nr:hypothetical protein CTAYLR_003120 [Chrysophaeum taylorii]